MRYKVLFVFILSLVLRTSAQTIEERIDNFVTSLMECKEIPGVIISAVKDDEVILTKGYGVKDLDSMEPTTQDTIFILASITKQFSGTVVGRAMEDFSDVTWTTPIRNVLGESFHLSDPLRTAMLSVRDTLAHRSGMSRHDPIRLYGYSLEQLVERMRFLPYRWDFRDNPYRYNNIMYGIHSQMIQTLTNKTFEALTREFLLDPLGMDRTTFVQEQDRWDEFGRGHYNDGEQQRTVSLDVAKAYYDTTGAPGALSSTSQDMAKWLRFQLNEGRTPDGVRLVSSTTFTRTHSPASTANSSPTYERPVNPVTYGNSRYAMGWFQGHYRDYRTSSHTGSQAGFHSLISTIRAANVGVFVGINASPDNGFRDLVVMFVLDLLLGEEPWLNEADPCSNPTFDDQSKSPVRGFTNLYHELPDEIKTKVDNNIKKSGFASISSAGEYIEKSKAPYVKRPLEKYQGTYGNLAYGNLEVYINDTDDDLYMGYGPTAVWNLGQGDGEGTFIGNGQGIFWYWELIVVFEENEDENMFAYIPFDTQNPPTFEKGLNIDDLPPPVEPC